MEVIEPTQPMTVTSVNLLIYAGPGLWKTSIAQTADDPVTLDFDTGAHRAFNRKRVVRFDNWEDAARNSRREMERAKTIVVDTVGKMLDMLTAHIAAEAPKYTRGSGELSQQGWGALKARFGMWMAQARVLGRDVVLIAHEKEERDGDVRYVRPDIQGGSYGEVMKFTDLVGHVHLTQGVGRVIDFNPSDQWVGKNAAGWQARTVPDLAKHPTFLADLLADAKAKLGAVGQEAAQIAAQAKAWSERIAAAGPDPALFDAMIAEANALPKALAIQVKTLLAARMKTLDVIYDKETRKCFRKNVEADELPEVDEFPAGNGNGEAMRI